MIAINVVNIHHLKLYKNFPPVVRTFKIYSVNNFHIYNIVLTIVMGLYTTSPGLVTAGL